jgi:outer membrane receptor protein involved in Fe transport
MKYLVLFVTCICISITIIAQTARISGKVINGVTGLSLANASITLVEKSKTVVADQNGVFNIGKLAPGTYSLKCTYIGFKDKIIEEIVVKEGESVMLTVSLEEKAGKADEVVVVAKARAKIETTAALLIAQKNSASVSDGITADAIKKTPDRNTGDVLKRVSGASIQDDRFAIIRGLNDRYNAAFINGAPLPSSESDRKAFAFDIFPSAILDNLVIYKTATPDRVGDFAGGIIDITTMAVSPQNFTTISFGTGVNSIATGKTRYSSEMKGGKDFLGLDDGTRAIPAGVVKDVFSATVPEKAEMATLFGNYKWGIKSSTAAPNFNFQFIKGFNVPLKDKDFFSALVAVTYNRNFALNYGERNTFDFNSTPGVPLYHRNKYVDSIYNNETVLALLGNVAFKLNNKNTISWKNNLSINTDNRLLKRIGAADADGDATFINRDVVRWFTSNQIFTSQLSGDHLIGEAKTKINWLASFSDVKRDIPNLSRTSYIGVGNDLSAFFQSGIPDQLRGSGTMLFIKSNEDIKSLKVDVSQPYTLLKNKQQVLKAGAGYQFRSRQFNTKLLGLMPNYFSGFDFGLTLLPENEIFLPQNLGVTTPGKSGFLLDEGTIANSNYIASSALTHAYLMTDQRILKKLRFIYGVRWEQFNQKLNTTENGNSTSIVINTTKNDFLPSVNFVYSVTSKTNLRLSYSNTVNRPEFRELAPFLFFEYVSQNTISGYDSIVRAKVKNYDFRFEFYPGKAQLFSASAFYKDFTNPIELIFIPGITNQAVYVNATSANVYGIEAEFRTLLSTVFSSKNESGLLSKITISANAALMKSAVKIDRLFSIEPERLVTNRALQGQSPYLINSSLNYNDDKLGLSSTISVNRVGDRIYIAGIKNEIADIYEKARTVVDFQVVKFLMKRKLELKLTARDILAQNIIFYSDFDLNEKFNENDRIFSSYRAPKVLSFSATYKF